MDILGSHSTPWLAGLVAALLATGMLAGLTAGLLGLGGGIVIVPVLYHVFGLLGVDEAVRMHVAVGTSLATIIPTSLSSARAHWRRGSLDPGLLRSLAPGVIAGVVAGSLASAHISGAALSAVFGAVAILVAANLGLRREPLVLGQDLPAGAARWAAGGVIGGLSTLMGIGGGTLTVPLLAGFGVAIRRAVGTASAVGALISVPGTAGFILAGLGVPGRPPGSLGYANLFGLALIVPMTVLLAPVGARLAHRIRPDHLKRVFALFLLATAVRMLMNVWSP